MPVSQEMPKILTKTGVVAAISTLAMAGSLEQAPPSASAEASVSPATDAVSQQLGQASMEAVINPPTAYGSEPQAPGNQDPHIVHFKKYVPKVKVPRVLRAISGCESGGGKPFTKPNYTIVNASGHGGAYQFAPQTWNHFHGYTFAQNAPPKTQDRKAIQTLHTSGTQPWAASYHCWGKAVAPVAPRR